MSLALSITKDSESTDFATIYLLDSTGAYNASTNTGGYGVPNTPAPTVESAWLYMKELSATSYTTTEVNVTNFGITATAFAITGTRIPASSQYFGLGTDEEIPDGIYQIKYRIYLTSASTVNAHGTGATHTITITNADAAYESQYIKTSGSVYTVVSFGTPGATHTVVTVTESTASVVDGVAYHLGFEQDLMRIIAIGQTEACVVESLPALVDACCDDCGDEAILEAATLLVYKFAADAAFNCGDFTGAVSIIEAAAAICDSTDDCSNC